MAGVLEQVKTPGDLKLLSQAELKELAGEIRRLIKDAVARRGGHLSSNLGLVELTIALHLTFDFSRDRLLWDVGHQAYVHKILTGRAEALRQRLREAGGISGFPNPAESEYDLFATGHAGTAIATAVGMALGDQMQGEAGPKGRRVVALVGDASIVNGLSFEGLNNAGKLKRQLLIVLNDNGMGIDVSQGALAEHLAGFRSSKFYGEFKRQVKELLPQIPLGQAAYNVLGHIKEGIKATISPNQLFEPLGFMYVGPVDGHDLHHLVQVLTMLRDVQQPVVLHVHTVKGRGYDFSMAEPTKFHSPSSFCEDEEGRVILPKAKSKSWTTAFAEAMKRIMTADQRVVVLTAAMPDGTGVSKIREVFPDRCRDPGIVESATVDIAAGMCKTGLRPVVAVYSTFLQRAFDQVFQEVSLQRLPVVFALDRAGLVGEDGAVHHGFLDLAYLRGLPGMQLCAPADEVELNLALDCALARTDGPTAIRYPRDNVPAPFASLENTPPFEPGKARLLRKGEDAALLAYGTMTQTALEAAEILRGEGIETAVYNMRWAKPVDAAVLEQWLPLGVPVVTLEDHSLAGGFGSACLELAAELKLPTQTLLRLGLPPDEFVGVGTRPAQLERCGLDARAIAQTVRYALPGSHQPLSLRHAAETVEKA